MLARLRTTCGPMNFVRCGHRQSCPSSSVPRLVAKDGQPADSVTGEREGEGEHERVGQAGLLSPAPVRETLALEQSTAAEAQTTRRVSQSAPTRAREQPARNGAAVDAGTAPRRLAATEVPEAPPAQPMSESNRVLTGTDDAPAAPRDASEIVRWKHTVDQLVRNGTTSKDPEIVAAILAEHAADTPPSTISRRRGVHHSTVGRILAAAAALTG
jgi:hypothetical protein